MSDKPGDTVGFRITSDPVEYEKFIALTTKAVLDAASRLRVSPLEFFEQVKTGMNAQAPEAIKAEILNRVTDYLEGNTQSLMGNPDEIGGYRVSIGPDGAVSWYQFDKDMNRIPLQDEAENARLNTRRNERLEKGLDHPWQAPTTEAHVDTIKLADGTVYQHTFGANGRIQQTVKTNPDGSRSEKSYDPATGFVTQEKQFDKNGALTFDSMEQARKKAETDKADADRKAVEQAAADKRAEQLASQPKPNDIATFDTKYYLTNNPDVADPTRWQSTAYQHFQQFGWKEGRKPNPFFDPKFYLNKYPDVKNAGMNPLDHWQNWGFVEGRSPYPEYLAPDIRRKE